MKLKIEIDTSISAAKVEVASLAIEDAGTFGSAIADIGCLLIGRKKNAATIDVVYNGMANQLQHDNVYAFRSFSHGFGLCGQIMASLNPIDPESSSVPTPPTSTH